VGIWKPNFQISHNNWDNIRNVLDADTNEFGEVFNVDELEDFCEEPTAQPEIKKGLQELRELCIFINF
jgi:hypothetical protein